MNAFRDYQIAAFEFAKYKKVRSKELNGLLYAALGLGGEAGEVVEQVKRILRDDGEILTEERKQAIRTEIGDVLWYAAVLTEILEDDLGSIASDNLQKLRDRKRRGVIGGSGDDR